MGQKERPHAEIPGLQIATDNLFDEANLKRHSLSAE